METPSARANFSAPTSSAIRRARIWAPTRKSVGFKSMMKNLACRNAALHTSDGCHTQVRLWFATQISPSRWQRRPHPLAQSARPFMEFPPIDIDRQVAHHRCYELWTANIRRLQFYRSAPLHRNPASPTSSARGRGVRSDQSARVARRIASIPSSSRSGSPVSRDRRPRRLRRALFASA